MTETINKPSHCKYCDSDQIIKYGTLKGVQRYYCKVCKVKFVSGDTIPKMQTPTKVIADSLNMHYEGMSLAEIRRNFIQQDSNYFSKVTPYNWEKRFTKLAEEEASKYTPKCGDVFQADETVVHNNWQGVKKKRLWLINVIDRDTRFLLASRLSVNRSRKDIALAFKEAKEKAGKSPALILTDGWVGYPDAIDLVFGHDTRHQPSTPFKGKHVSTNIIEREQGTLKERIKVMRGLKTLASMQAFLNGWKIHYNYFRPHLSLNDQTPAQAAGIKFPYANWKELIEKQPYERTARIPIKPIPAECKTSNISIQTVLDKPITLKRPNVKTRKPRAKPKLFASVKQGRIYKTRIGSGTVLSRRPLGRRK